MMIIDRVTTQSAPYSKEFAKLMNWDPPMNKLLEQTDFYHEHFKVAYPHLSFMSVNFVCNILGFTWHILNHFQWLQHQHHAMTAVCTASCVK